MIVREVLPEEKQQFDKVATHPLQSWAWGKFREKTGLKVIRLGVFDGENLTASYLLTVHPIPHIAFTVLYFPKGPAPDKTMIDALKKAGGKEKAIFVKIEPSVPPSEGLDSWMASQGCQKGKPLFTKYTFILDLTKSEEELLAHMKPKTRYNIHVAQRHGVKVIEDNSPTAFEKYLELTAETTKRQRFYAHTADYHRKMWETLNPSKPGSGQGLTAHLFKAIYQGKILATYIFFIFNNTLYYPYGASIREHKEVMAPYLIFWEAIKFAKKLGCKNLDMWGSLGPNPDPKDPWFGFHRFKEGFGGILTEFAGTYDLVLNYPLYSLYNLADSLRWAFLRLKSRLPI